MTEKPSISPVRRLFGLFRQTKWYNGRRLLVRGPGYFRKAASGQQRTRKEFSVCFEKHRSEFSLLRNMLADEKKQEGS